MLRLLLAMTVFTGCFLGIGNFYASGFDSTGTTGATGVTGVIGATGAEAGIFVAAARKTGFDDFILDRRLSGGIIAPDNMWSAFDKNKGLADAKFRGKRVDVRGRIKSFAIENKNVPTMYFAAGPGKEYHVVCTFEGEPEDIFNGLERRQLVTVVGTCAGRVGNDVIFKNCKIKSRK